MTEGTQNIQSTTRQEPAPKQAVTTFPAAVISLVNSTIGTGMLGIQLASAKGGLVPALILHVLMALNAWTTFYFLTYASEATGMYTYGELSMVLFGPVMTLIIDICMFICLFGVLTSS